MHFTLKTLHLIEPFRIAHGVSSTRQVLRVQEGGSVAEAPFVPYYGEDPRHTLALLSQPRLPTDLPRTARLAINLLQLDQLGKSLGQPFSALASDQLGPALHSAPPGCRGLGIPDDLGVLSTKVHEIARQFSVIKLKLGSGDAAYDAAIVATARKAAPEATLLLDANGGWRVDEAPALIEQLALHRPALIEQPIHHTLGVAAWQELRRRLPHRTIPLYADESAQTAADITTLAPFVDGVNVKLLKCGSFEGAVDMIATARRHHLQILVGCMVESSLGTTAAAHLAPWVDWIDLDGHLFINNDDYSGITYDDDGRLKIPHRPGIGAVPNVPGYPTI